MYTIAMAEQQDYIELGGVRYVTPPIGARRTGLKITRIYSAIKEGVLPVTRLPGSLLIKESDFWEWVPVDYGGKRVVKLGRPTDEELRKKNRLRIKPETLPSST